MASRLLSTTTNANIKQPTPLALSTSANTPLVSPSLSLILSLSLLLSCPFSSFLHLSPLSNLSNDPHQSTSPVFFFLSPSSLLHINPSFSSLLLHLLGFPKLAERYTDFLPFRDFPRFLFHPSSDIAQRSNILRPDSGFYESGR